MAIYGYTKNYKLIKPKYDTDTWHDYEYDNLDTIDAVLSAIYASGDWQGFWKSNTHYNVGDIVIDRDTDTMYKVMVEHTTSAGSFEAEWTAHHDYYELWSPNDLAESWATKTDGKVSDTDYSSKAYAISSGLINDGSAKEWAVKSGKIGNTNEYSAKKYATDAHNDYISMTTNPNVVAVGSNINNVNTVGQSISSVNTVASNVASVNAVGSSISSVNTAASNMAAIKAAPSAASNAANSANNSHIWAEGTDAQVQALGGVHSSKGWAEQSTNANVALTNSPYTTNRILEIPQDIKLELNNGTLTLKAGSKVYVPNGFKADGTTLRFGSITVASDLSVSSSWGVSGETFVYYTVPGNNLFIEHPYYNKGSGTTFVGDGTYYYTDSNYIRRMTNGSVAYTLSFPLAKITITSDNKVASIDQVFNGFGYIGSTVFALPGVKCQSSTGRNADGTCTNFVHTVSSVFTYEAGPWNNATLYFLLWANSCEGQDVRRFTRNKEFSSQPATYSFDENENKWYFSNNNQTWNDSGFVLNIVGKFVVASGKITSFEPYTVDSVLNSNLSNLSAAGQAKFDAKANVSNTVTTDTNQEISGTKRFTGAGNLLALSPVLLKENNVDEGGQIYFERSGNSVLRANPYIDLYTNKIRFLGLNSNNTINVPLRADLENNQVLVPTPATNANDTQAATTAWVNSKMQVVSALPAAPDANVFYFIPG